MDHEKLELVQSLKLGPKQLWIRDYYLSKIEKKLVKANGLVKLQVSEEENLRMQLQLSADEYGVSPVRV